MFSTAYPPDGPARVTLAAEVILLVKRHGVSVCGWSRSCISCRLKTNQPEHITLKEEREREN